MSAHILDNPVWNSLNSLHASIGFGDEYGKRFNTDISPLTGVPTMSPNSELALLKFMESGGAIDLLQTDTIVIPSGSKVVKEGVVVQLCNKDAVIYQGAEPSWVELGANNRFEMLELAQVTEPGPFAENSYLFGGFIGVFENNKLAAMAGERIKVPGFTEVSGVCTHPDFRGRGYAKSLSAVIAKRILARGETAFLHAYDNNEVALSLYKKLGFLEREKLNLVRMKL